MFSVKSVEETNKRERQRAGMSGAKGARFVKMAVQVWWTDEEKRIWILARKERSWKMDRNGSVGGEEE
jgi:hypothetical protein